MLRDVDQIFKWIKGLFGVYKESRDPFRAQASRILQAFVAHGISPTQIARIVPEGMLKEPSSLADPSQLKKHLTSPFVTWVADALKLEMSWLDGDEQTAHFLLESYKKPSRLLDKLSEIADREESSLAIHVFKSNPLPLSHTPEGPFSVVLEERFLELDGKEVSRFYFLTEGATFDHSPCVTHLLQICAIAHHLSVRVWGRVLGRKDLTALWRMDGLIPEHFNCTIAKYWHPDDALWTGLTGDPGWKRRHQAYLSESLVGDGMGWLAEELEIDRVRLSAMSHVGKV